MSDDVPLRPASPSTRRSPPGMQVLSRKRLFRYSDDSVTLQRVPKAPKRTKEYEANVPRPSTPHSHGRASRMMRDMRGPIRMSAAPKQQAPSRIRTTLRAPRCISDFHRRIEGDSL